MVSFYSIVGFRLFLRVAIIKKGMIFLLLLLHCQTSLSTEITCSSGQSTAATQVEIAPVKITVSSHITDYTELYRMQIRIVGDVSARCSSSPTGGSAVIGATLTNVAGAGDHSKSGYIIFPTNISGLGISVNSLDAAGSPPIPAWPATLEVKDASPNNLNYWRHQNVAIRIWKVPGDIPSGSSPFALIAPSVIQGVMPGSPSDSLDPAIMTADRALGTSFWTLSVRDLVSSASFYVGTCNLRNSNQTVLLGKHMNFKRYSDWQDATFIMDCPVQAYGYGGMNGTTANNKNKPPSVKIVPYTATILHDHLSNPISGTIALDPGGAEGYGVQLAWGDYAAQSSGLNPTKPVVFNIPVSVSTLVSGYQTSIPLGTKAPSAAIKMAARFIQTETIPKAGHARASVEVIINYE